MTRFEQFEEQLAIRGWNYDVFTRTFRDGVRIVKAKELIAILPKMTRVELANYVADNWEKCRAAMVKKLRG
jgi:hypothetical protein